jgi:hypothetical protein
MLAARVGLYCASKASYNRVQRTAVQPPAQPRVVKKSVAFPFSKFGLCSYSFLVHPL